MANEAQVKALKALEERCAAIVELASKKGSFIERSEWGEVNFKTIKSDIETVLWFVKEIKKLPTHILPQDVIQNSTEHLTQVKNIFDRIDRGIPQGNSSSWGDGLANEFSMRVRNIMSGIGIWMPLLSLHDAGEIKDWTSRVENIGDRTTHLLEELEKTKSHVEKQRDEIDQIIRAARAASAEAGAAEFTHEFSNEAKAREKRSKYWLIPTALFSALALSLSILAMFELLGDTPTDFWEAVYGLGGRVIAISVLFYAAVWSGRIALANMNLASVNKHRAVSLQTLQAFHKSAEDPAAKDAIVLEAARAVYENVPSGYIGRQATGPGAGARTLEVIRGANRASRAADEG